MGPIQTPSSEGETPPHAAPPRGFWPLDSLLFFWTSPRSLTEIRLCFLFVYNARCRHEADCK